MFSFFTNFLHGISTMLTMLVLGAALGVGIWLVSRVVTGTLASIAISAAAGAVMLLGVHWTGLIESMASDSAKQQLADLRAQNEELTTELAAAKQSAKDLADMVASAAEAAADNALTMEKLRDELDKRADDPNCALTPEERDLINQIQ